MLQMKGNSQKVQKEQKKLSHCQS